MSFLGTLRINTSSSLRSILWRYCQFQSFSQLNGISQRTRLGTFSSHGSEHPRSFSVYAPSGGQNRMRGARQENEKQAESLDHNEDCFRFSFFCDNPTFLLSEDFKPPVIEGPGLNGSCFIVLLATPIHISVLEDNSFIAEKLLNRLFGNNPPGTVHIVTAIVDQIPHFIEKETALEKPDSGPIGQIVRGWDGLSFLITNSNSEVADEVLKKTETANEPDGPGTMSFETKACHTPNLDQKNFSDDQAIELRRKITLPLANTIFHNGRRSTLQFQCWTADQSQLKLVTTFVLQSSRYLRQIEIPALTQTAELEDPVKLGRMQALTPFREVGNSMGNVLSTLRNSGNGTDFIPASKELESCLPLALRSLSHDTYEVWAQIIPRSAMLYQEEKDSFFSNYFHIGYGHHFHRVTGGGGGWGKRQGLVALDPDGGFNSNFDDDTRYNELTMPDMSLTQTAKPGDIVRFHLLAQESNCRCHPNETNLLPRVQGETSHRNVFGSMGLESSSIKERDFCLEQTPGNPFWEVGLFGCLSRLCANLSMSLAAPGGMIHAGVSPLAISDMTASENNEPYFQCSRHSPLTLDHYFRHLDDLKRGPKVSDETDFV